MCGLGDVSTGGATSYIRLDPFLSFVPLSSLFTAATERQPGCGLRLQLHLSCQVQDREENQNKVDLQTLRSQ